MYILPVYLYKPAVMEIHVYVNVTMCIAAVMDYYKFRIHTSDL